MICIQSESPLSLKFVPIVMITTKLIPTKFGWDIQNGMHHIESFIGKKFGDESDPLLFSVQSCARV